MAEDQLRTLIDGISTRLQAELETELAAVTKKHEQALVEATSAAEAAAEQRWADKIDATRLELTERLHTAVAAARTEVEQKMGEESARVRAEAEEAAADAVSQVRRELEESVGAERARAEAAVEAAAQARRELEESAAAERARAEAEAEVTAQARRELEEERARADAAAESAAQARRDLEQAVATEHDRGRAAIDAERQRAARELSQTLGHFDVERDRAARALEVERERVARAVEAARKATPSVSVAPTTDGPLRSAALLDAVRAIDAATSLSDALAAAVRGAALEAPRVVLFIVSGTHLQEWPVSGVPSARMGPIAADAGEAGILGEVVRRNETMLTGHNGGPAAPAFALLPPGRVALAVPFVLAGRPVAVLYADEGAEGAGSAGWQETVQILGRHASAYIAYLTATRTAQAMQSMGGASGADDGAPRRQGSEEEQAQGARRYARLLVSEIKLYNEGAVRQGRERRDLLKRLDAEIERARRLYDERVDPMLRARDVYFQQELLQTLADGDSSLLG